MKTSSKILLIGVSVIAGLLLVLVISTRVVVGRMVRLEEESKSTAARQARTESLHHDQIEQSWTVEGFSGIRIDGPWKVRISRGDNYSVKTRCPEYLSKKIEVRRSGAFLEVSIYPDWIVKSDRISLDVTVPEMRKVEINGAADYRFSGFDQDTITFDINGAANINGTNSRASNLNLRIDGAANIQLSECPAENADVRMNGAGNVELTMAGGVLSGEINGFGAVRYGGDVSSQRIDVNGIGMVKHK